MKWITVPGTLLICALTTVGVSADQSVNRQSIENLLDLSNVQAMLDTVNSQFGQMVQQLEGRLQIAENERDIMEEFTQQMQQLLQSELSWDKLKEPMIEIYQKHFNQQEINDLVNFYKTESGQAMISKMPAIVGESMSISSEMLSKVMPEVQRLAGELEQNLRKRRSGD